MCILGIGAMVVFASCSSKKENATKEQKYKTINPLIKDTIYTSEYVAEINAFQNVEIRTRVGGFIESVLIDEGHYVHNGQVLFTINNKQFLQDLQKAKAATKRVMAELVAAEIELAGSKKLLDKNFISQPEYDLMNAKLASLNAKLEEAQADEEQANLNLSFAQVRAPFDGIINRIPNKSGSLVEEGTLLTTISYNKEMLAYFNVSEIDYLEYIMSDSKKNSKEVSLVLANGKPYPHKGVIETTESEFDNNTGTIAFRAKFPNPDNILKHGASGKVQLKSKLENALLIPQKATFDRQENLCVFIVGEDNSIQARKINPLLRLPHLFAVGSGLSAKDQILYEGVHLVKEGDKIVPEMISFSQVINH